MKQDLLACPFCGKHPHVCKETDTIYCVNVRCPELIAQDSRDSFIEAIDAWNTRADCDAIGYMKIEDAEYPSLSNTECSDISTTPIINWEQRRWSFVSHTLSLFLAENGMQYMQRDRCGNPIGKKDYNFTSIITDYIAVADELINQLK